MIDVNMLGRVHRRGQKSFENSIFACLEYLLGSKVIQV